MTHSERVQKHRHFAAAFQLLSTHEHTLYTQNILTQKLASLGTTISTSLFSNLVNKRGGSDKSLIAVTQQLDELIAQELDMAYDAQLNQYYPLHTPEWVARTVPTLSETAPVPNRHAAEPTFHADGRRTIQEKTAFFQTARHEVNFLGVRLRQFVSYFNERKDAEFKDHIIRLLQKGVRLNCYLLNPSCNAARLYFADRAIILPEEKNGEMLIPNILTQLHFIQQELKQLDLPGQLSIYTYDHLPSTHFLIIDGDYHYGKLLASNYLFGIKRSKVPVLEVHKQAHHKLFSLYWSSFKHLIQEAKPYSISVDH